MTPLVSVIIPFYNAEKFFLACLQDIVNQTLQEIEIILIDDCSPDNSYNIAEKFAVRDSRIILLRNDKNRGQGFSRERGIEISHGKYFTWIDADDRISANCIKTQYLLAEKLHADIVWNAFRIRYRWYTCNAYPHPSTPVCSSGMNFIRSEFSGPEKYGLPPIGRPWLIKKAMILEHALHFPSGRRWGENMEYAFQCLFYAKTVVSAPQRFYIHNRSNPKSITREKTISNIFPIFESMNNLKKFYQDRSAWDMDLQNVFYQYAEKMIDSCIMDCSGILQDIAIARSFKKYIEDIDSEFLNNINDNSNENLSYALLKAAESNDVNQYHILLNRWRFREWKRIHIPVQITNLWHKVRNWSSKHDK